MVSMIICGFEGIGKTEFCKTTNLRVLDLETDSFAWIKDNNHKKRNPNFPGNYIECLKACMGKYNIILLPSYESIRQELKNNEIHYLMIYPPTELKKDYIMRYRQRGDSEKFINFMIDNWDRFMESIQNDDYAAKFKLCGGDSYLYNLLSGIKG